MKIRISGTNAELDHVVQCIAALLPVREVSRLYANRNAITRRVYLDVGSVSPGVGSGLE